MAEGYHAIEKGKKQRTDLIPAVYSPWFKQILLNERHWSWAHPATMMRAESATGWFSSASDDHVIVHEIGHALHDRAIGPDRWRELNGSKLTKAQKALVKREVSSYGSTHPLEFVAETYAGLASGKSYNEKVMALYQSFGGPIPRHGEDG